MNVGAPARVRAVLVALSLSPLLGWSCALVPRAEPVAFVADLRHPETGAIRIEMRLRVSSADTVALSSFIQPAALRLDSIQARQDDEPLAVSRARDDRGFDRLLVVPRVPNRPLQLAYTVRPGAAEEIAMSGLSGYRFGHFDTGFGVFGARQLFLLPMDSGAPRRIEARFLLPGGWTLATPWRERGGDGSYRFQGPDAAARLIDANLGAGVFETAGASGFRVQALRSLPDTLRRRAIDRALRLERELVAFLGRPSQGFELILAPRAPDGMLLSVAPGSNSWALSLGEGTPTRWMSVGRAIGRAYLEGATKVSEDERWILESLPTYLLTGISERDGWRSRGEWLELFHYETATLPLDLRDPHDLGEASQPLMREWRGALVLDRLSRQMAAQRPGEGIEQRLRAEAARGRRIDPARLIDELPSGTRTRLDPWLAPTAHAIPFPGAGADSPVRLRVPDPVEASTRRGGTVDLYFGGRNLGLLEQCGCRSRQAGGLARRATVLERALRGGVPSLAFELGDAVPFDQQAFHLDEQKQSESDLVLDLMAAAGQKGSVVSHAELHYGGGFLADRAARLSPGFHLLSANVSGPGLSLTPTFERRLGGVEIRLVGLEDPSAYHLGRALEFEDAIANLRIEDPVASARRIVASRSSDGLTVVAGSLAPSTVRALLGEEGIDVIVTNDYFRFTQDPRFVFERPFGESLVTLGTNGRTLVVLVRTDAYALARLRLGIGPEGVTGAEIDERILDERVADAPSIRRAIDTHYERLALRSDLSEPGPIGNWLRAKLDAGYVGAAACASCHGSQTEHWQSTMHATAYATLLAKRRQGVPGCFACHVTGYRQPTGYRAASDQGLRNVQCESCHGPASEHVRAPRRDNIVRMTTFAVCVECHDAEHSEMTQANFEQYRLRVVHAAVRKP